MSHFSIDILIWIPLYLSGLSSLDGLLQCADDISDHFKTLISSFDLIVSKFASYFCFMFAEMIDV